MSCLPRSRRDHYDYFSEAFFFIEFLKFSKDSPASGTPGNREFPVSGTPGNHKLLMVSRTLVMHGPTFTRTSPPAGTE